MANERFVTIENRIFNATETRTTITGGNGWFSRTLHTIGSGNVDDICVLIDGYIKSTSPESNPANGFTITSLSFEIVGYPTVPITFGGNRSYTVTPGEYNTLSDFVTANQMKSIITKLPIGQEFWVKALGTVPGVGASFIIPTCVRNPNDASGTQFGWYNPANTTIVNGVDVPGVFTWTGTNADMRNAGWAPLIIGHFSDGDDPVVTYCSGDSIPQGLQDNTPKRTGRGWYQYVLAGDGTSSPATGIRAGYNASVSGDSAGSQSGATKTISKMQFCTDIIAAPGTNDISMNGSGSPTGVHASRIAIINNCKAVVPGRKRPPKSMLIELHPQSTTGSPTKVINSAPNTGWGIGETSAQVNELAIAAVGTTVDYFAYTPSIRQSTNNTEIEYYLWKYTTPPAFATSMTPDGQHPGNAGVVAWFNDVNPVFRQIQGGSFSVVVDSPSNNPGKVIRQNVRTKVIESLIQGVIRS